MVMLSRLFKKPPFIEHLLCALSILPHLFYHYLASNRHLKCNKPRRENLILHTHTWSSLCLPNLGNWHYHSPTDSDPNAWSLSGKREREEAEREEEQGKEGWRREGVKDRKRREWRGVRKKGIKGGGGREGRRTEEKRSEGGTKNRSFHYRKA